MRKIGLLFIILLSFAQFVSCSNNDDIPEKAQIGDIQTDCDNYGSGQRYCSVVIRPYLKARLLNGL